MCMWSLGSHPLLLLRFKGRCSTTKEQRNLFAYIYIFLLISAKSCSLPHLVLRPARLLRLPVVCSASTVATRVLSIVHESWGRLGGAGGAQDGGEDGSFAALP